MKKDKTRKATAREAKASRTAEAAQYRRPSDPGRPRSWEGLVGPEVLDEPRVDLYLAERVGVLGRSQQKARGATIRVNGKEAKPSRPLKPGDRVELSWVEEPPEGIVPERIDLKVLYEDSRSIVIDKAQGMVTHPGHGNRRGTLANALQGRLEEGGAMASQAAASQAAGAGAPRPEAAGTEAAGPEGGSAGAADFRAADFRAADFRAGVVHRLDKDTSGVIIAAKDAEAQAFLASQFKERQARKEYLAVVQGRLQPSSGRVENRLGRDPRDRKRFAAVAEGGKAALTEYKVLARYGQYSLVSLRPRTGRTHQLRVHLAGLGTPILGDPIYGRRDTLFPAATLMLHAYRLKIRLPGAAEASVFRAPLPARFTALLAELERRFGKAPPD